MTGVTKVQYENPYALRSPGNRAAAEFFDAWVRHLGPDPIPAAMNAIDDLLQEHHESMAFRVWQDQWGRYNVAFARFP